MSYGYTIMTITCQKLRHENLGLIYAQSNSAVTAFVLIAICQCYFTHNMSQNL